MSGNVATRLNLVSANPYIQIRAHLRETDLHQLYVLHQGIERPRFSPAT
jgi:non-ribosomal peptide synthetase component F